MRACRFPDCFCGGPDDCGTPAMDAPPDSRAITQAAKPVYFAPRNCICHFHKTECDCCKDHNEHHSDCRCKTCRPELWMPPIGFNPRRATFKAILWAFAAAGIASLVWAMMDANGFNPNMDANGNIIRPLDPNPKTCFEYRYRMRNTFCGKAIR